MGGVPERFSTGAQSAALVAFVEVQVGPIKLRPNRRLVLRCNLEPLRPGWWAQAAAERTGKSGEASRVRHKPLGILSAEEASRQIPECVPSSGRCACPDFSSSAPRMLARGAEREGRIGVPSRRAAVATRGLATPACRATGFAANETLPSSPIDDWPVDSQQSGEKCPASSRYFWTLLGRVTGR